MSSIYKLQSILKVYFKDILLVLGVLVASTQVFSQGTDCASAQPFCTDNGAYVFPNTTNNTSENGPYYGCLGSQPNPAWYFCKIKDPGNITIKIKQRRNGILGFIGIDVDFICWGPFNSLGAACGNLTASNVVDCSFSTAATEYCDIPNAQTGQYYMLLLTNYSNRSGKITFEKDGGSATTDCCAIDADPKWSSPGSKCKNAPVLDLNTLVLGKPGGSWRGTGVSSAGMFDPSSVAVGTYTIWYKVSNGLCTDSAMNTVNVYDNPIVDYAANTACLGAPTTFTDNTLLASGTISTYEWVFDSNDPTAKSNLPNPSYIYPSCNNGAYQTSLKITTTEGCVGIKNLNVNVYCKPTAAFTISDACKNQSITIVNNSIGATTYQWDFDNDNVIDNTNILPAPFLFSGPPGVYDAHLIVKDANCFNDVLVPFTVHPVPIVDYIANSSCINVQPILFDGNPTIIATGVNVTYNWNYGDGTTGNGITSPHNYNSIGTYISTLTVTSDKGCVGNAVKTVEVYPKPSVNVTIGSACETKPMAFNASILPGSPSVSNWLWDFNNSISTLESNGQTVSYVFSNPGNNPVALISISDRGCRDTLRLNAYVDYKPLPAFSVDKTFGCPDLCVTFSDNTPPVIGNTAINATWKWEFGDGSSTVNNSGQNQSHCYTNTNGTQNMSYDVKLIVTTNKGCSDSLEKTSYIAVYPIPTSNFSITPADANVTTPMIYFTNLSTNYSGYTWYFGDGETDTSNDNPIHTYNSPVADFYNAYLIVNNSIGCADTSYMKVEIKPGFTFYVPNAFTPGDDGNNDVFSGKGIGIAKYEMWIYDRWGKQIYYTNEIDKGWNGQIQGSGKDAKQDVYVWKINIKDVFNKPHEYVGHVTLMK